MQGGCQKNLRKEKEKLRYYYSPMGTGEKCCKGFYMTQSRKRSVTINNDKTPVTGNGDFLKNL